MVVALVVGAVLAHQAQRHSDVPRRVAQGGLAGRVTPDPRLLRVAAMGQPTLLADLMWTRAVLNFAELSDRATEQDGLWVRSMVESTAALDPTWRTVYFYGGSLLRVMDDSAGSNQIFEAGAAALPDDPYFPFSRAMNAYLYDNDVQTARIWMERAASLPGAPPWYRAAAGGMLRKSGDRGAALRYLAEQMETIEDEGARAALEYRYNSLLHDQLSEELTDSLHAWEREHGQRVEDLTGMSGRLPPDPFGEGWVLGPDHVVRSAQAEKTAERTARVVERHWLTEQ
ncbi:MAG: hypothetical protein H6742_04415 [Alphaproteobacteria bacterium]|nr:hypothetical protein [Alphaproteobacteria bacterium]